MHGVAGQLILQMQPVMPSREVQTGFGGQQMRAFVALAKASMGDLVWHLDLRRHGKPVAAPGRVEPFAESQIVVKDAICPGAARG